MLLRENWRRPVACSVGGRGTVRAHAHTPGTRAFVSGRSPKHNRGAKSTLSLGAKTVLQTVDEMNDL